MTNARGIFWMGRETITLQCETCGKETEMVGRSKTNYWGAIILAFLLGLPWSLIAGSLGTAIIFGLAFVVFYREKRYWMCTTCGTRIRK